MERNNANEKQPPRGGVVPINDQVTGLIPEDMTRKGIVKGYDFDEGVDFNKLLDQTTQFGLQATNFGLAINEINNMIKWRLSDEEIEADESDLYTDPEVRKNTRCTIFFSYTSNMVSCGMREIICYLAKHKMIDCIVTTAGGIEEDFIKCLAPTYIGSFNYKGEMLRKKGVNRIGNMVIANDNYCKFEDWIMPHLDQMLVEQKEKGTIWSPSKIIQRLGEKINDETSIYHWCAKNKIPVFCPALTDGSMGDMIYSHSFKNPGFIVDIAQDIVAINTVSVWAKKTGMIILGGGIVKHHVCNANLFRSGADFSVFINTGHEYDGSDSGAHPDEAVSWGKIKMNAAPVKISTDASLVFPLIVAKTFAQNWEPKK